MANTFLKGLTVQEAVNASGSSGVWTVNPVATHGGTATTDTEHVDVTGSAQIGIYAAGDIYFNFSASNSGTDGDCNTSNDLIIPGSTLTFITVPQGLRKEGTGDDVYFNHLGLAEVAVRIVEV